MLPPPPVPDTAAFMAPTSYSSSEHPDSCSGSIPKDDSIWVDYIKAATIFDISLTDQWRQGLDSILIFVTLLIAILTSFVVDTENLLEVDPGKVTNQILLALYVHQVNGTETLPANFSIPAVYKPQKADLERTIKGNNLLFSSLTLCVVTATTTAIIRLWVYRYRKLTTMPGPGSAFNRALRRQRAFSGVQAWKMDLIIDALPLTMVPSIGMFWWYIYTYVGADMRLAGYVAAGAFALGLSFLVITQLAGAFVPGCPFQSPLSDLIRWSVDSLLPHSPKSRVILLCAACPIILAGTLLITMYTLTNAVPGDSEVEGSKFDGVEVEVEGALRSTFVVRERRCASTWTPEYLLGFYFAAGSLFAAQTNAPKISEKYYALVKDPALTLFSFSIIFPLLYCAYVKAWCNGRLASPWIMFYLLGSLIMIAHFIVTRRLAKTMPDNTQAEAVAWLLGTPSGVEKPNILANACKVSCEDEQKAFMLSTAWPLMEPLFSSALDSGSDEKIRDYLDCLVHLSSFEEKEQSFLHNQASMLRPEMSSDILEALKRLMNDSGSNHLRNAASRVLKQYECKRAAEEVSDATSEGNSVTRILPSFAALCRGKKKIEDEESATSAV